MCEVFRLDQKTADRDMLKLLTGLESDNLNGRNEWVMDELMFRGWGITDEVKAAIDGFTGSEVNKNWLNCAVIMDTQEKKNEAEALRQFQLLDDPSGRRQEMAGWCFWEENVACAFELYQASADRGCAAGI